MLCGICTFILFISKVLIPGATMTVELFNRFLYVKQFVIFGTILPPDTMNIHSSDSEFRRKNCNLTSLGSWGVL